MEAFQYFASSLFQSPQGVGRVYIFDDQLKTVALVEVDFYPQQHLDTFLQKGTERHSGTAAEPAEAASPKDCIGLSHDVVVLFGFLHQTEKVMSSRFTELPNFAAHPQRLWKVEGQGAADVFVEVE
jgi:hypothetical protein